MPGLRLHLTVARDLAGDLSSKQIEGERGAYYLGATTPDIRVLTRWDRRRTHFFDLDDFDEQSGMHRLFEQEPSLRDAASLDAQTAAFMAGYISHLVMDEDYITRIYRPMFGERSSLATDDLSDVMDKCLQWDIERADCEDVARVDEIREALAQTAVDVSVDFIGRDTLAEWRDVSLDVISQAPTLDRLVRFLGRRMPAIKFEDEAAIERFAEGVPALLERTWRYVGEERVREYMRDTKARARDAIKEYLS